jgi:ketosteroid isomerase-like protein
MSGVPTNSELLLAGYEAWNQNDCEAWLACLQPDVEISTSGVFPDLSADYRGHGEATRFWRELHAPWETFRIDVEPVEDEDDCALAAIRFRAKGVDSGIEVDMRFGMGIRVRDGLASDMVNRRTLEEAREALRPKQRATASTQA